MIKMAWLGRSTVVDLSTPNNSPELYKLFNY